MTLGKKIQLLRNRENISQEELAMELGVSRQAISKWELDASVPDTANIIQLGKFFSVSMDYLLIEEVEKNEDIPVVQQKTIELNKKFQSIIFTVSGLICTGIGLLGHLIIFLLSTMIKVPVIKKEILANGVIEYSGGGSVMGYNYFDFIGEYRLQALCIFFYILIAAGIFLIAIWKRQKFQK